MPGNIGKVTTCHRDRRKVRSREGRKSLSLCKLLICDGALSNNSGHLCPLFQAGRLLLSYYVLILDSSCWAQLDGMVRAHKYTEHNQSDQTIRVLISYKLNFSAGMCRCKNSFAKWSTYRRTQIVDVYLFQRQICTPYTFFQHFFQSLYTHIFFVFSPYFL